MKVKKDYKEIVLLAAVFMLVFSISKEYTDGKRLRKKICKNLKKSLAIQREFYSNDEWLYYVNTGHKLIAMADKEMFLENGEVSKEVNPSQLLELLSTSYGSSKYVSKCLMKDIDFTNKDISDFKNIFIKSKLNLTTLMFTNRLKTNLLNIKKYDNISDAKKQEVLDYVKNL